MGVFTSIPVGKWGREGYQVESSVLRPIRKWHGHISPALKTVLCPLCPDPPCVQGATAEMLEGPLASMPWLPLPARTVCLVCSPPSPPPYNYFIGSGWRLVSSGYRDLSLHFRPPSELLTPSNSLCITSQLVLPAIASFLDNPHPPTHTHPFTSMLHTPKRLSLPQFSNAFLPLHMLSPCLEQLALSHLPGLSWNISSSWEDCWLLITCSPPVDIAMDFLLSQQPDLCWDGLFAWLGFLWLAGLKGTEGMSAWFIATVQGQAWRPVQGRCSVDISWASYGNNEAGLKGGISGGLRNRKSV